MKTIFRISLSLLLCFLFLGESQGQKISDFLKESTNEISKALNDVLLDKAADVATDYLLKQMNSRLDSVFRDAYESDTTSTSGSYAEFLNGLNKHDQLPESYNFDLSVDMVTTDEKGNENSSTFLFDNNTSSFGVEIEDQLVVFDSENSIMVTYDLKEKTGFAFSDSMMKLAGSAASKEMIPSYTVVKTSETKTVLGYTCTKYTGSSETYDFIAYVSDDFPIDWTDAFGGMYDYLDTGELRKLQAEMPGMVLESESTDKEKGETYNSKVTKVNKEARVFLNSDYQFATN